MGQEDGERKYPVLLFYKSKADIYLWTEKRGGNIGKTLV